MWLAGAYELALAIPNERKTNLGGHRPPSNFVQDLWYRCSGDLYSHANDGYFDFRNAGLRYASR